VRGQCRCVARYGPYIGKALRPFRADVHLVQNHHRLRAACGGQYEVAFETPEVVVTVESHHDGNQVDIRRQNLLPTAARALAYDERSHWLVWLSLDPRWNDLRGDPRFDQLRKRVGLIS